MEFPGVGDPRKMGGSALGDGGVAGRLAEGVSSAKVLKKVCVGKATGLQTMSELGIWKGPRQRTQRARRGSRYLSCLLGIIPARVWKAMPG